MFFIGVKYFWSSVQRGRLKNVLRLTLAALSINIGVFIAGMALIRGFQSETLRKTLHMHGHAQFMTDSNPKDLDVKFEEKEYYLFKTFPQLKEVWQMISKYLRISADEPIKLEKVMVQRETQGAISHKGRTDGIIVKGLSNPDAEFLLNKYVKSGSVSLTAINRQETAIIGHRLAKRLRVRVGDMFKLSLQAGASEVDSIPIQVAGIFDFGFYEYDLNLIFVRSEFLKEYNSDEVGTIYINQPEKIDEYIGAVQKIDPGLEIYSWRERNRMVEDIFKSQIRAIMIIMGLFVLSAIIQSITSLFVLLSERSYDISVLTMLGLSPTQKYSIFAAYGLLISISNTILGVLVGIALTVIYPYFRNLFEYCTGQKIIHSDAFWISDFDPQLLLGDVAMIAVGTLVVMSIAMLIAAHFTSKISVMEGIRD